MDHRWWRSSITTNAKVSLSEEASGRFWKTKDKSNFPWARYNLPFTILVKWKSERAAVLLPTERDPWPWATCKLKATCNVGRSALLARAVLPNRILHSQLREDEGQSYLYADTVDRWTESHSVGPKVIRREDRVSSCWCCHEAAHWGWMASPFGSTSFCLLPHYRYDRVMRLLLWVSVAIPLSYCFSF